MYRFIKLKHKEIKDYIYDYQLYCTDVKTLFKHSIMYLNPEIKKGIEDYFKSFKSYEKNITPGHFSTWWSRTSIDIAQINECDFLSASTKLEIDIMKGKINCLVNHGNICLRDNGLSYMIYNTSYDIIDEVYSKELIYPNSSYTEKDINILRWKGGKHYYVKIKNLDVVDPDGNQKWNTRDEALKQAKIFLKNINKDLNNE